MLTPWIRTFNYIEDYFRTVYEIYSEAYIAAYPVTYYSLDTKATVWEDSGLETGSYEKLGVGDLSGVKWKVIYMLPVFAVEPVRPTFQNDERGITNLTTVTTQIVFPSLYGLRPLEGDMVDLSFGYKVSKLDTEMLYTVSAVNIAHQGDILQLYQLSLKHAPISLSKLDKQISEKYQFYEHDRKILPLHTTSLLLKLQKRSIEMITEINEELFNKQTGLLLLGN